MVFRRFTRRGADAALITLLFCAPVGGRPAAPTSRPAAEQPPADRIVPYAPGVRINWARSIVELDGRVVLREGPLELFACARHTREHESIIAVSARPLRIFEALGLVGLKPGTPVGYDERNRRWTAARGDPLHIDVVIRAEGAEQVFGIHEWMRRAGGGGTLGHCDWVFAGSRRLPGGRFAADAQGTIICVVDFDSALIALPEAHTPENAALWLEANPERIPPVGTACVLRISSAASGRTATTQPATDPPEGSPPVVVKPGLQHNGPP